MTMRAVVGECFQCRNGLQHICGRLKLFGIHRDGSFAEYATLPAICARKIPAAIPPRIGAVLEPHGESLGERRPLRGPDHHP